MARGRYPARIRSAPPDPLVVAHYLITWRNVDLYAHPDRFPPIASPDLFGNDQPLALELGCATGEFLCELAARHPQINYLGVEIVRKPLYRAVQRAADRKLPNIKFLQADAKLIYPLLPSGGLHAVYLHFPLPLTTAHQRRQHVLSSRFITEMQRALAPGGRLHVLTDDAVLFRETLRLATAEPQLALLPPDRYHLTIDEGLKSHCQRLWESQGREILRCELAKQGVG